MSGRSESRSETPRSNEHLQENTQNIDPERTDTGWDSGEKGGWGQIPVSQDTPGGSNWEVSVNQGGPGWGQTADAPSAHNNAPPNWGSHNGTALWGDQQSLPQSQRSHHQQPNKPNNSWGSQPSQQPTHPNGWGQGPPPALPGNGGNGGPNRNNPPPQSWGGGGGGGGWGSNSGPTGQSPPQQQQQQQQQNTGGWGSGDSNPPPQAAWGQQQQPPPVSGQQQQQQQPSSNAQWNPQAEQQPQQPPNSSWGPSGPPGSVAMDGINITSMGDSRYNYSDNGLDEAQSKIINSNDGWGKGKIDQLKKWVVDESPETSRRRVPSQSTNGTEYWERGGNQVSSNQPVPASNPPNTRPNFPDRQPKWEPPQNPPIQNPNPNQPPGNHWGDQPNRNPHIGQAPGGWEQNNDPSWNPGNFRPNQPNSGPSWNQVSNPYPGNRGPYGGPPFDYPQNNPPPNWNRNPDPSSPWPPNPTWNPPPPHPWPGGGPGRGNPSPPRQSGTWNNRGPEDHPPGSDPWTEPPQNNWMPEPSRPQPGWPKDEPNTGWGDPSTWGGPKEWPPKGRNEHGRPSSQHLPGNLAPPNMSLHYIQKAAQHGFIPATLIQDPSLLMNNNFAKVGNLCKELITAMERKNVIHVQYQAIANNRNYNGGAYQRGQLEQINHQISQCTSTERNLRQQLNNLIQNLYAPSERQGRSGYPPGPPPVIPDVPDRNKKLYRWDRKPEDGLDDDIVPNISNLKLKPDDVGPTAVSKAGITEKQLTQLEKIGPPAFQPGVPWPGVIEDQAELDPEKNPNLTPAMANEKLKEKSDRHGRRALGWNQQYNEPSAAPQNIWAQSTPNWNSHPQPNAQSWGDLKDMTDGRTVISPSLMNNMPIQQPTTNHLPTNLFDNQ